MSEHPLVSVIIAAHNAQSYVDEALRSALDQTYPNVEIVVVDDGSTDQTATRVMAYAPRVHCIRRVPSSGAPSVPRNQGLRHSKGEYIAFLDADDFYLPDRISTQADFLSDHPEAGLVFMDYCNFSSTGIWSESHFQACQRLKERLGNKRSLLLPNDEAAQLLLQENFGIAGSFMVRRKLLVRGFEFEPTLRAC